MAKYIDICIQPVLKKNVADYRKMTKIIGEVLVKHGALASRDYVAEDENALKLSFPKKIKIKPGEVIIFAVAEFKSKAHREKVFKLMMKDPKMEKLDMHLMHMNHKRMVMGGFSLLFEIE